MNIRWDTAESIFVAEFSSDFTGDLDAVKAAGFKTFGPPAWIWYAPSTGIKALNRLREKRPASGLTITPEALEVYKPLAAIEEQNANTRKQLADVKKQLKKERKESETVPDGAFAGLTEEKWWVGAEDLPPWVDIAPQAAPEASWEGPRCVLCEQPVYFYEQQSPPMCLWCEMHPVKNKGFIYLTP
jgi:hypothetical protein